MLHVLHQIASVTARLGQLAATSGAPIVESAPSDVSYQVAFKSCQKVI